LYFNKLVREIEIVDDGRLEWDEKDWILTGVGNFMEKGLVGPRNTRDMVYDAVARRSVYETDDKEEY
jgi:hypothetical protein